MREHRFEIVLRAGGRLSVRLPTLEESGWLNRRYPLPPAASATRRGMVAAWAKALLSITIGGDKLGLEVVWPRHGDAPGAEAGRERFLLLAPRRLEDLACFDDTSTMLDAAAQVAAQCNVRVERSLGGAA